VAAGLSGRSNVGVSSPSLPSDPTRRLSPIVRLAPAKLNLTLAVIGRRHDGYHALHSVVVPLGLADRLSLAVTPSGGDSLASSGFDPGPLEGNVVLRAVAATRARIRTTWPGAPAEPPAIAARLEKRIPVAAGLGGGSSDAAAAIDGALEVWAAVLPDEVRVAVGLDVGSDVPLFLHGGSVLIEGRGETVTPLHGPRCERGAEPGILLVTPPIAVRTARVFEAWAGGAMAEPAVARRTSEHFASEFGSGLSVERLVERAAVLASANDLWPAVAALEPGLVALRRGLMRTLGRPIGMSGSGPTLWSLYPSLDQAAAAAKLVRAAFISGALDPLGSGEPFVAETTIVASRNGSAERGGDVAPTDTAGLEGTDE
jgi:4-diphosphocytidyl-2-C-methyl-D-erythritol kinase